MRLYEAASAPVAAESNTETIGEARFAKPRPFFSGTRLRLFDDLPYVNVNPRLSTEPTCWRRCPRVEQIFLRRTTGHTLC